MIEVENLTKVYGRTRSLDGVSFSVGRGEVLGFLGPNGAGKTTTMRILTGLTRASSGRACVGGLDSGREHASVRQLIGYLPEDAPCYPEMRARDYLHFMAEMKRVPGSRLRAEVDRVLDLTGMGYARKRLLGNMSKGMRQRIGLSQALLGDPPVLILDEPMNGLDPEQIKSVRDLIRSFRGERTVIFSTHILANVAAVCTHAAILTGGRVIANGPMDELKRGSGTRRLVLEVSGDAAVLKTCLEQCGLSECVVSQRIDGEVVSTELDLPAGSDKRADLVRRLVERGIDVLEMREPEVTLDEIFLGAVRRDGL